MKKLKIAFIGCGSHANSYIYPSLANVEGAELSSVCSLDAEEAELNRKRHGADSAYTDYRKMIETEKPDGVIIVGGGSGTLSEVCASYMSKKPMVAIRNLNGPVSQYIDGYIDHRENVKIIGVDNAQEAVKVILELITL